MKTTIDMPKYSIMLSLSSPKSDSWLWQDLRLKIEIQYFLCIGKLCLLLSAYLAGLSQSLLNILQTYELLSSDLHNSSFLISRLPGKSIFFTLMPFPRIFVFGNSVSSVMSIMHFDFVCRFCSNRLHTCCRLLERKYVHCLPQLVLQVIMH